MSEASSPPSLQEEGHQVLVTLKLSSKLLTQLASSNNGSNQASLVTIGNGKKPNTPKLSQGQVSNNTHAVSSAANSTSRGSSNVSTNAARNSLDRTGKPVRKWTKSNIELKSFTGFKYDIVTWSGGPKEITVDDDTLTGNKTPPQSQQSASGQNTPSSSIPGTPSQGVARRNGGSLLAQSPLTPSDF